MRLSVLSAVSSGSVRRTGVLLAAGVAALAILAGCGGGDSTSGGGESAGIPFGTAEWQTDFSQRSVELSEFASGGPPKDGIPAIDDPRFVSVGQADEFLEDREPVAVLQRGGEVRAYPFQILIWHEIVNDEIAGEPVAVTFCPLCNSTVAFSRDLDGRTLDFGTTGKLRNSDLVMYDRQTESWWQQITAEAIVGELTGAKLEILPSQTLSWGDLRTQHPEATVLSRETGFSREYGSNPYVGYDDPDSQPFLLDGKADDRLPPKERVTAIKAGSSAVVYPFSRLQREAPINDEIGGSPAVVLFDPEVASALDTQVIADGRSAGAAAVFERRLDGRLLSFEAGSEPGSFRDRQTGSTWEIDGTASAGPLSGERLEPIPSDDQFWFALAAFFEDVDIRG